MLKEFPTTDEEFTLWKLEHASDDGLNWYSKRTQSSTRVHAEYMREELLQWINYVCDYFPEYITATPTNQFVLKIDIVSTWVYSLHIKESSMLYNKLRQKKFLCNPTGPFIV